MDKRAIWIGLAFGVGFTLLTMLVPYRYCQNGRGRGFPFAAICPSCGGTVAAIGKREEYCTQVFDAAKFLGDVGLWGGLAAGAYGRLVERRRRPAMAW